MNIVTLLRKLHLAEFVFNVREFVYQFLRVDTIRSSIAAIRYFTFVVIFRRFRTLEPSTGDVAENAVLHNRLQIKSSRGFAVTRSNLLLYPFSAIRLSKSAPILSIGPRTEGELLNLLALGYHNFRALDLISYSPWVDLGDMHAMPYKDNEFAAVIMGWVIAYSDNRKKAALEAVRVVRDGGIIAVGAEYAIEAPEETQKRLGYVVPVKPIESVSEMLGYFAPHVDRIFFSHDRPSHPIRKCNLMAVFSVKKSV